MRRCFPTHSARPPHRIRDSWGGAPHASVRFLHKKAAFPFRRLEEKAARYAGNQSSI